jgi:uncharacterized protein YbjT (DUF2867 family)
MNYAITGGAGHVSRPLVKKLLKGGHTVTVVGRNPANLRELTDLGARAAIGSVEDIGFLVTAFRGADAIYTMVPPKWDVTDWKAYIGQIGNNYAEAIKKAGVRFVVNLSSVGAHMATGCGPVSGLYQVEQVLNSVPGLAVRHLRPGYFYENFLGNIPMIKNMNILGGNYGGPQTRMVIVEPEDIAAVAAEELTSLKFTGHSIRYIASDERTTGEITSVLASAIGRQDLPWVEFSDDQSFQGMKQAGLSDEIAKNYVEMGRAIRTGELLEDYWKNHPSALEKTKLEEFAKQFASAYERSN